jgi:hypothetical protein
VVADWAIGVLGATGFGVRADDAAAERCGWTTGVAMVADAAGIAVGSLVFVPQPLSMNAMGTTKTAI